MTLKNKRHRRGLTLIEIIVVVAIIGVLMAAVGVSVVKVFRDAKVKTATTDLVTLHNALKAQFVKVGHFPSTAEGFAALVESGVLDKLPKDPWGTPYVYTLNGGRTEVRSAGEDRMSGSEDDVTESPE